MNGDQPLRQVSNIDIVGLRDEVSKLEGHLETEYYEKQTSSGGAIKYIGFVVAFIMAVGSSFAAMNTMYAAVAYRSCSGILAPQILRCRALGAAGAGDRERLRPPGRSRVTQS